MDESRNAIMQRVIRIVFLDFHKAFDLIDRNKGNIKEMVVRSVLIRWFASYLNERSHFTQFGKEASDFVNVTGGVPHVTGGVPEVSPS